MAMLCEMPEWSSNNLWIAAPAPNLTQETNLDWVTQVDFWKLSFHVNVPHCNRKCCWFVFSWFIWQRHDQRDLHWRSSTQHNYHFLANNPGWWSQCEIDIDSTRTSSHFIESESSSRSGLHQSSRWQIVLRWLYTRGGIWLQSQLPSARVYGDY